MRRHIVPFIAAISLALPAFAQTSTTPPVQSPAQPDPLKPYQQVTVTQASVVADPGFAPFRAKVADAARKKDRAALAKLVVSKGFFWERETGDGADKKKSGIDNLNIAIDLKSKDSPGWDMLAGFAEDATGSSPADHPGATCAPADPGFEGKAMDALLTATQSDIAEWGYPIKDGVEVRDSADPKTPVTMKLGHYFVRVAPDASAAQQQSSVLRIVTPAGKYGYVAIDDIAPIGNDQICYAKEGADWKITGYVGAGGDGN